MTGDEEASLATRLPTLWGDIEERTPASWQTSRRAQIRALYEEHVYGRTPQGGRLESASVLTDVIALDGAARRREVRVEIAGPLGTLAATMLVYTPAGRGPRSGWPAFLGLNMLGNHSVTVEDDFPLGPGWVQFATTDRGDQAHQWPIATILERGYAVATLHAADLEADHPRAGFEGVRGLFHPRSELLVPEEGDPGAWGTIGAWAFGMSRALDALAALGDIDAAAVVALGHSRLGKTALWAAFQDARFAGVISNDSGCAGASLFRHRGGENVAAIVHRYGYWFAPRFAQYADRDEELPIDQHLLLAGILPTPVHVASAADDHHADPRGEYLSTVFASPIARLFGGQGTAGPGERAAPLTAPVELGGLLSYHLRSGGHDMLGEDWGHFLDFADRARSTREPTRTPEHD